MVRQKLKKSTPESSRFRFRGLDNTRIEALSDGVFALAIALLLLSTEVPKTFEEIRLFTRDIIPFGITIMLLTLIWYRHYIFFVRYGLKDATLVALNALLLFLVLYYVYPLKFLFKVLYEFYYSAIFRDQQRFNYLFTEVILPEDTPDLMIGYGAGACLVFLTLLFMYLAAYSRREKLELNEVERFDTLTSIYDNCLMGVIPLISLVIAIIGVGNPSSTFAVSGIVYCLYSIVMPMFGMYRGRKRKKLISLSSQQN